MVSGKIDCEQKLKKLSKKISFKTNYFTMCCDYYIRKKITTKSPIKIAFQLCNRRASCIASPKGSLTVEAAMILPVFLFFFLGMVYIISAIGVELAVKTSLYETGKELAENAYITQIQEENTEKSEELFRAGGCALAESTFIQQQGAEYWDNSIVKNGSQGFYFGESKFLDDQGRINLRVRYKLRFPFLFVGEISLVETQSCCFYAWIGSEYGLLKSGEEMVYVTRSGTVYHRSLNCQHLKVTIRTVTPLGLPYERNSQGGKYYPCTFCGKGQLKDGVYYVTEDGERFHTTKQCSGLKRNILTIPISAAGEREGCMRCVGNNG